MKPEHIANQLDAIASHAKTRGRDSQHVFRSRNLTIIGSIAAVCIGLAWTPTNQSESASEPANPLQSPLFEFNLSKETGEPAAGELPWDEAFLNPAHWDKMPPGRWHVESRTDTVIKYSSDEIRELLGGPARLVRIRTDAKTGAVQSIEVIWADFGLSLPSINFGNLAEMNSKEQRAERKHRQETIERNREIRENFGKTVEASIAHINTVLEASWGKPKPNRIGRHRDVTVNVLDYTNHHGTTLRLFHNTKGLVMATIHKTSELETQDRRLLNESVKPAERSKAAAENVTKLPNGDVIINNLPMHNQGDKGACVWASGAMILEYWGSPIPLELLTQRNVDFNATIRSGAQLYGAAEDTRLQVKQIPIRMNSIMDEIDAGRPVQVRRYLKHERTDLHRQWRDATIDNPGFEIPEESRKEQKENWANDTHGGHASVITGYNKEKEVILLTESWGEGHRNYRVSFEEFKAGCRKIEGFSPK